MRVMKIGGTNGLPSAAKTRFPKDGGEALGEGVDVTGPAGRDVGAVLDDEGGTLVGHRVARPPARLEPRIG